MDPAVRDTFDRVAKKQKLSETKSQELVDQVSCEIELALQKIQLVHDIVSPVDQKSILLELKANLGALVSQNQLEMSQKELNMSVTKYTRVLQSCFPDISKAYRNVEFDFHIVNQIIASYFYRQGMFDLGDSLLNEADEPEIAILKSQFLEMYQILEAVKVKNLEPALSWASSNREKLQQMGSHIELKLHRLQFVDILEKGNKADALNYVKTYLSPFASIYMDEIKKLTTGILWIGRLKNSPYSDLLDPIHWENLPEELTRQFCSLLGQSYKSPLNVALAAGIEGLPTLLKLANVMAAKKHEWDTMKHLPVPVNLRREFQFHSTFVCPVSRDQGSADNPPMLIPCGHVLCKQSIMKLSKSSTRTFKCPYCPSQASVDKCKQLYF